MKTFLAIFLTAAIAVPVTWHLAHRDAPATASAQPSAAGSYQCAMHPWIKSDKPGRCTICGMELTPVHAGAGDASHDGIVMLNPSMVRVLNVATASASIQPLERTLLVVGTIDDDATRHRIVSAYIDGRIETLNVNQVGMEITAGQPMASFYSKMLLVAEGEYRLLDGRSRESAAIRLRQLGLSTRQINALPDKPQDVLTSDIDAPMSGTVVARKVYEGQYVKQGDPLFEIADFSSMWFLFDAYETDLPWLREGGIVDVTLPSLPGKTIEGKIAFIDPNFDEVTRSTKVRVVIQNPMVDGRRLLSHRVSANGQVRLSFPDLLTVPRSAVLQTGPKAVVYVDQGNGAYQRRDVRIGRRGDHLVEILSGVKAGEKVVTQGNLLIDGQAEIYRSAEPDAAPAHIPDLTKSQADMVSQFVTLADSMAAALAADDLSAFNKASEPTMDITARFIAAMKERPDPAPALTDLEQHRHIHSSASLKEARQQFHSFIVAAEVVLQPLRHAANSPPFQVWECPMVHEAIPGSAAKGRWIQTGKRAGANPFFGHAMPRCGEEIQP